MTGATGFIGRALCAELARAGHALTAVSRDPARARTTLGDGVECVAWGDDAWKRALARADRVFHLAGEPPAGRRWTPAFKRKIRASRIDTTRALVQTIRAAERRPAVLVSASGVGYYGDRGDETVTEQTPPGDDFRAEVCVAWEAEAREAEALGVRVVCARIGIVLGDGGPLRQILYPLPVPVSPWKLGLGGPLGGGRQWMPWVHLDDVTALLRWAAENPVVRGALNVVAPQPVTNAAFTRALGRVLRRPAVFPIPAFAVRLLAGEVAGALLTGQRALPALAQDLGYRFEHPEIEVALRSLL
uniref:Cell division inhibitor Slr1223 (YfcH in EC), contains epimerase/dehydratase and DUF1731 domains n=1 Tax=uncultured Armatimonadetes bacterium TaxID=157466 RepID=A0A6J4J152_9BACT|nr:Cell division inhibitor Slr1223 (YfcH in EC), contains epimerase/dehydratase and DUF1731 domains [uncultured Armatimonadetes bacterium]